MEPSADSGLTPKEQECMDHLVAAHRAFVELEIQHPGELEDFVNALHRQQELLALRIARRLFPSYWKTYIFQGG
jgi:hypothetical protein